MKYRFEITYETTEMIKVNDFMSKLDLGEGRVCLEYTYELSTNRDYSEVDKIKKALKESIESIGMKVWSIKGGVWE